MIKVKFNIETITLEKPLSLAEILLTRGYTETCYAITLNRDFIPRCQHAATFLKDNDVIKIISPMQGG